ncbi:MAG: segregation/condensation protein A [Candidatus Heimdallarchaeota archaeon]|nr:segregation/condensation protein A [Candidatus Heimdallarchaeota archaeon]
MLLDLIQKSELDITALSLAKVTDKFLSYIKNLTLKSADNLSEFLIIAAKLVQIKSEALLPRPPVRDDGEENLGEKLAQQLRLYRQIKQTAFWLNERTDQQLKSYLRLSNNYQVNVKFDIGDFTVNDLVDSIRSIYLEEEEITGLGTVISIQKITIKKRVQTIINLLTKEKIINFSKVLNGNNSRLNVIIVFLAVLELIKQDFIKTSQLDLFSDIQIEATDKLDLINEFELALED